MTLGFLDFNSYTFVGGFTVQRGKDLIIPDSLILSQTMLVKWQIRQLVKGATIEQIPPAILSTSLEIPGLGMLSQDEQQIQPSQQGKDVVQFWHIDPSLPHKLKFSQVSDLVANSVLEFYTSSIEEYYMGVTNPSTQDSTTLQSALAANNAALAQAVGASTGSAVQQALANQAIAAESKNSKTKAFTIKPWSGDIGNHLILPVNLNRMGASAAHLGKLISTTNTSTVYIAIGDPAGRDNMKFEYAMAAGGTYIVDPERDTLATYMWLQPGLPLQQDATITVTEYLP
jgi:hypothetical protein